jgi:diguanylate cyclase (GGDEF)-like protein
MINLKEPNFLMENEKPQSGKNDRFFRGLPQSFNPDEIIRDEKIIEEAQKSFYEIRGKELEAQGLKTEVLDRLCEDFVHSILQARELERMGGDLGFINKMNEQGMVDLKNEKKEGQFDQLTGLKNRKEFFKDLKKVVVETLGLPEEDANNDEKMVEALSNSDISVKNSNVYVMMSDISYLGFANDLIGHAHGDELLRRISEKMEESLESLYRYGGDELTGIYNEPLGGLLEKQVSAEKSVNEIKNLAGLEGFGLTPNIDIGFANIAEGVALYKELLNNPETKDRANRDVLANFEDLWIMIADKRAYKVKVHKRILLLIDRFNRGHENTGSITKGAYSIDDEKISELAEKYNKDEDVSTDIDNLIREKELAKQEKISEDRERIQTELVLKYLDII